MGRAQKAIPFGYGPAGNYLPDLYELGMSNFGLKILYQIINDRPDMMCDRSYAPQEDMEALMRSAHLPLFGWGNA